MIISIDVDKAFDNSISIYDKNTQQSGYRGNVPQHNNKGHVQ